MKKITLIALTMFFFVQSTEQEEREAPESRQMQEEQQEERRMPQEQEQPPEQQRMPQEQDSQENRREPEQEERESPDSRQMQEGQEEERRMPQEQEQPPEQQRMPQGQDPQENQREPEREGVVTHIKELEDFFSLFPNPAEPQFQISPNLNGIITLVYEETLGVPPIVFAGIKRLYALIQSLTLQESNIEFERLSEEQKTELNEQMLQRCIDSSLWQAYNKTFVTESLEYGMSLLKSVHQEEKMIFTYIPNFETAYYSKGYTEIRNGSELVRLSLVLSDGMRDRSIRQCDWRELKNIDQLYEEIEKYKEGEFYRLTKEIQTLFKSSKRYPFPQGTSLINHNGQVSAAFNHFIEKEESGRLSVSEYAQFIMNIDKNNHPYLTAFGNFIFTYSNNESGPFLSKNPIFHDLFSETDQGLMPQPAFLKMLALDGIKLLNAHMAYLFNAENLESTMQKLVSLDQRNQGVLQQFPNILPYVPSDYPYLEGIKELLPLVSGDPDPQASVQSWDSFWHSVGNAFESAGDAIANTATSAWHSIKDAGEAFGKDFVNGVEDFGRGVGYFFAAAVMAIGDPSKGASFFQASFSNFSGMANDIGGLVTQVGAIVKAGVSVASSIAGQTIGAIMQDPKLGESLAGLTDALADGIVNVVVDMTNYVVEGALSVYRLAAEALLVVEQGIMAIVTGGQDGTWSAFKKDGDFFAKDIVTSILTELTFLTKDVGAILTSIMKGIAYLCSAIVDLIGDVFGDIAALAVDITGGNGIKVFHEIKNGVNKWRRTIIGGIMLVGGIAITVGSLGTMGAFGITMAIAGTGMMVIGTMGDVQQDLVAHKKKKTQDAILAKYKSGVPGQAVAARAMQSSAMTEATVQFAAEKQNSERGLVYYQNFLNSQFNSQVSLQSSALGNAYKQLSAPDPYTGVEFCDPGYLYGIKTGRMALNPSGGLYTFNVGRNTFGQETAVTPQQTLKTTQNTLFTTSPASTELWINQKDLSNVWGTGSLEVEVRFRTIYETEGNFYIGIFMSEQVMNLPLLQALNKNYEDALKLSGANATPYVEKTWENLDTFNRNLLNYNTLSRNLVIFKEYGETPSLGFYQHEGAGDGWLNKNIDSVTYQRGVWYRMKMAISGESTRVKCWEEAAGETNEWVTFETPQARRLPTIKPIQLPDDQDPFELIVTKPAPTPKKAPTKEEPIERAHKPQDTDSTGAWKVTEVTNEQPETQPWEVIRSTNDQPQASAWKVKEVIDVQPKVVAWTVSGKAQQTESERISGAFGSVGMISSGAAIEYQILSPATKIEIMPLRKKENIVAASSLKQEGIMLNESEREHQWLLKHGTAEPQMQSSQNQNNNQDPNSNYPNQSINQNSNSNYSNQGPNSNYPNQDPNSNYSNQNEPPNQEPRQRPQHAAAPVKPAHSTFWYLQHGQSPPSQKNINSKISDGGKFAVLGGPS